MIEKHIVLEDIDPVVLYGSNNSHLQVIKALYPKLRIVARDNVLRVLGDEEQMASFEEQIEKIRLHVLKYNSINEEDIIDIIKGRKTKNDAAKDVVVYNISGKPIKGRSENQQKLIDAYAKDALGDRIERLSHCYYEYRKLEEEWANASMDSEERSRELSFLQYEVDEIEQASLRVGEDEELEQLYRKFSNGKKLMDAVNMAYAAVGAEDGNASERIGRALRELSAVAQYDEKVAGLEEQLADIDNLLADVSHEMAAYLSDEEFDDETYFETEKRLDLINHLKSKYGTTIEAILTACQEKTDRINILNDYDEYLNQLSTKKNQKKQELDDLCEQVSKLRKKESVKLCTAIQESLKELNFLDVRFTMEFVRTQDYTALGTDDVEFMISTNPGEPVKPLGKVASGGELSRIMLAIKTVMAESDDIATLIFDEIDSGISGRTAQMVSEKMNLIAKNHQIICITHLPQIAAMADSHFLIEKSVEHQSTYSRIKRLKEEESIEELARMLGGVEITDTVMQSAREMKQMAARVRENTRA